MTHPKLWRTGLLPECPAATVPDLNDDVLHGGGCCFDRGIQEEADDLGASVTVDVVYRDRTGPRGLPSSSTDAPQSLDLPPYNVPSRKVRIWDVERGPYGQETVYS